MHHHRKDSDAATRAQFDELLKTFDFFKHHMAGYPSNQAFDYSPLFPALQYSINNIGDPFHDSNYTANTHEMERQVIYFFAELMRLPHNQRWGYVTNGGTEGNLFGMYVGRETIPNAITYFSEDVHYSIFKIVKLLQLKPVIIKSQPHGEMDYNDLLKRLKEHSKRPALIMANIGTTMKGAVDDVVKIREALHEAKIKQHYIHADCALSGMILPFVEHPQPYGFDNGFDSCAISGHKMIGSPIPCGIALTRKPFINKIAQSIEYVEVLDTTIMGSRNAFTPLMLWYAIQKKGVSGFRDQVAKMLETAEYTVQAFQKHNIKSWRNKNSITCVFPRPHHDITRKWNIASQGNLSHIITVSHVTKEIVDQVIQDILQDKGESIELT
ncbi:MAG: histidine decarboxylase [Candidatus Spechtbacteria bacterium SB0662_bin_43]|uniref:Histidine decarboxylase n=1 Tax=Candidatus Spechtbacteria bacterium SB0662_bin_43 TaxID=2604897 RepID=A0A845D887_9BACT|nr:histidine decarboxylase [Candidatus Spechtbacteria bacterium SB0662_bin_43]